jgi:hypothetical protein
MSRLADVLVGAAVVLALTIGLFGIWVWMYFPRWGDG